MKKFLMITFASAVFGVAAMSIYANDDHHSRTETQRSYAAKGEVLAIDKAADKVKLKHEPVPELDWPTMTMFFSVADKALLDDVEVGDQVKFQFVRTNKGALITQIKSWE